MKSAADLLAWAPSTPDGERWADWSTALKPAHEPIWLVRKPFRGPAYKNVLEHGTGALNIGATRIGTTVETWPVSRQAGLGGLHPANLNSHSAPEDPGPVPPGRWPANVIIDEITGAGVDIQSGFSDSTDRPRRNNAHKSPTCGHADSGGASRFFYCPKVGRKERSLGLAFPGETEAANKHPTVKPIELMRWLCRLVTPPGGRILDPFAGSGTTGIAAQLEGFGATLIEREPQFAEYARGRNGALVAARWLAQG